MFVMNWYVAKLIYQVVSGDGAHQPQFDEQFRLIRADELEWAWEKAQVLGRMEQCSFINELQQTVEWRFIDVVDVHLVHQLEDGAELYSNTLEPTDVEEYLAVMKARAQRISDTSLLKQ